MPNGHGGIPRYGSSALLLILTFAALFIHFKLWIEWLVYPIYFLAVLFSWRFSSHLFMWGVTNYGGATSSDKEIENAKKKYIMATIVFSILSIVLVSFIQSLKPII